jgi:1,2-diacylglycerol 3-alpha-glucosyltransferase
MGPYHRARVAATARLLKTTLIELSAVDNTYAWDRLGAATGFERVTLFDSTDAHRQDGAELRRRVWSALDRVRPDCVAVPGWADKGALAAIDWCLAQGRFAVVMSESTAWDESRVSWKEWVKRRVVGLCVSSLAGGIPHADYLVQLGMPRERIFLGYDAVDNGYFKDKAEEIGKQKSESRNKYGLPEPYFLASARFVEKKNLPRLIHAYSLYRKKAESRKQKAEIWDLVLLGDGPLRDSLNSQLSALNLRAHMQMPGFKQYPDLPAYYGLASAFIHASTTEQWGLVVNEAMASGLPVLVSNRCGCAPDLVQDGVNGFTFDPCNLEELAQLMLRISAFNFPISAFGSESQRIIADWGPERFASGLKAAVDCALAVGPRRASIFDRLLLRSLMRR